MLATLAMIVLTATPQSSALEPIECTASGGTAYGGALCAPPSLTRLDLHFRVTALCRDCNGETWTLDSLWETATGDGCSCGTFFTCMSCRNLLNANRLVFYTWAAEQRWIGQCVTTRTVEASVQCQCAYCDEDPSPILISITDGRYELTSAADGVHFDFDGDGAGEPTAWTAAGSDEAFLVLDRNQNGVIDNALELFGDKSPQFPSAEPNGWRALAIWDDSLNGGNENGKIEAADYIFSSLQLWIDKNHNGCSETSELFGLGEIGLAYLDLDYMKVQRKDRFGNTFRYKSKVGTESNGEIIAWDVFFVQK